MSRTVIRAAWIVVVACALAAPASAQEARVGTPPPEAVSESSDALVSAFATPTFGVSYITLKASDFQPYYSSTYNNIGANAVYCTTEGTDTPFYTANVPLPNGSRIVSIETNVYDNDAT